MNPCINIFLIILLVFVSIMTWTAWEAIAAESHSEISADLPDDDVSHIYQAYIRMLANAPITAFVYIGVVTGLLCLAYFEDQRWHGWEVAMGPRPWLPPGLCFPTWVPRIRIVDAMEPPPRRRAAKEKVKNLGNAEWATPPPRRLSMNTSTGFFRHGTGPSAAQMHASPGHNHAMGSARSRITVPQINTAPPQDALPQKKKTQKQRKEFPGAVVPAKKKSKKMAAA